MRLHVTKTLNIWHHFLLFRKKHWGLNDTTTRRQRERLKSKQTNKIGVEGNYTFILHVYHTFLYILFAGYAAMT